MTANLKDIVDHLIRKIEKIEHHEVEASELAGLSGKQIFYLDTVNKLNNPTLSELAVHLSLSRPSITAIVDRFVDFGYVKRVKSDADKRRSHIHLTPKGQAVSDLHEKIHASIADRLTRNLTADEVVLLEELLGKALA